MTESVKGLVRGMLNFIAGSINRVIDSINYLIRGYNSIPTNPFKVSELYRIDVPAFAEGGIVDRPTLALVGEGGEREFIIPESKMAATAANYLSGGGSSAPASSGGGSTGKAQISITTGPVLQQGGEQYVTLYDLERAMQMTADGVYKSLRTSSGRYATGVR
jgi:SLT domain-containing protein